MEAMADFAAAPGGCQQGQTAQLAPGGASCRMRSSSNPGRQQAVVVASDALRGGVLPRVVTVGETVRTTCWQVAPHTAYLSNMVGTKILHLDHARRESVHAQANTLRGAGEQPVPPGPRPDVSFRDARLITSHPGTTNAPNQPRT